MELTDSGKPSISPSLSNLSSSPPALWLCSISNKSCLLLPLARRGLISLPPRSLSRSLPSSGYGRGVPLGEDGKSFWKVPTLRKNISKNNNYPGLKPRIYLPCIHSFTSGYPHNPPWCLTTKLRTVSNLSIRAVVAGSGPEEAGAPGL